MTLAFVFVECQDGQADAVKNSTQKVDGVQEAYSIAGGDYDVLVKVDAEGNKLDATIATIRRISGIAALATSIVSMTVAKKRR